MLVRDKNVIQFMRDSNSYKTSNQKLQAPFIINTKLFPLVEDDVIHC